MGKCTLHVHFGQVLKDVKCWHSAKQQFKFVQLTPRSKGFGRAKHSHIGRKTSRLSDKRIRELLTPFTQPSKYWSSRANDIRCHLTCSLKTAWLSCSDLHQQISLSRLTRIVRAHNAKIGIAFAVSRQDLCNVCHTWDQSCKPKLNKALQDCLKCQRDADCKYWDAFVASCKEKLWNTPQPPVDWIEFWESILEYLKAKPLCTVP